MFSRKAKRTLKPVRTAAQRQLAIEALQPRVAMAFDAFDSLDVSNSFEGFDAFQDMPDFAGSQPTADNLDFGMPAESFGFGTANAWEADGSFNQAEQWLSFEQEPNWLTNTAPTSFDAFDASFEQTSPWEWQSQSSFQNDDWLLDSNAGLDAFPNQSSMWDIGWDQPILRPIGSMPYWDTFVAEPSVPQSIPLWNIESDLFTGEASFSASGIIEMSSFESEGIQAFASNDVFGETSTATHEDILDWGIDRSWRFPATADSPVSFVFGVMHSPPVQSLVLLFCLLQQPLRSCQHR